VADHEGIRKRWALVAIAMAVVAALGFSVSQLDKIINPAPSVTVRSSIADGWSVTQVAPNSTLALSTVICPSASHCWLTGFTAHSSLKLIPITPAGGAVGSMITTGMGFGPESIVCPEVTTCIASYPPELVTFDPRSGTARSVFVGEGHLPADWGSVGCDSQMCLFVGLVPETSGPARLDASLFGLISFNLGRSWKPVPLPFTLPTNSAGAQGNVQCTRMLCLYNYFDDNLPNSPQFMTSNGVTWQRIAVPLSHSLGFLCTTREDCLGYGLIPGSGGLIDDAVATADGGTTWSHFSESGHGPLNEPRSMDCDPEGNCMIYAGLDQWVFWNGETWGTYLAGHVVDRMALPPPPGISCPKVKTCVIANSPPLGFEPNQN
jgi:hypothetical protein